jgi:hypothetical protein
MIAAITKNALESSIRRQIVAMGVIAAIAACEACGAFQGTPSAADEATVAAYQAEQLACVDSAETRGDADACRARVRARFGRLDGGAE